MNKNNELQQCEPWAEAGNSVPGEKPSAASPAAAPQRGGTLGWLKGLASLMG